MTTPSDGDRMAEKLEARIPLKNAPGMFALVDADDFAKLNEYEWRIHKDLYGPYARRYMAMKHGRHKITNTMHREILGLSYGDPRQIDHINRNGLDNRRCNLRITDTRGNGENRKDQSPYGPGISCDKRPRVRLVRYQASVQVDGKKCYLGRFDTPEEASTARAEFLKLLAARRTS